MDSKKRKELKTPLFKQTKLSLVSHAWLVASLAHEVSGQHYHRIRISSQRGGAGVEEAFVS